MVPHPTCSCPVSLDRCDGSDLLVGLEGCHLVAAPRRECGLVRDREPYDRFVGCPGRGVIAQGPQACGHGSDRHGLRRDPSVNSVAQYGSSYVSNTPIRL